MNNRDKSSSFISYLNTHFKTHPHFEMASKVFETLDYIESNLAEIASQAGKVSLLRHPTNKMAFHLNGLETPKKVTKHFSSLISKVRSCQEGLLSVEDEMIRHQLINIFINNINDSIVGCMEVRVRNAITFFGIYKSAGLLSINDLMQDFYGAGGKISIERLLAYFSDKVDYHVLVLNQKNEPQPLTWSLIHDYVKNTFGIDNIKEEWLQFAEKYSPVVLPVKKQQAWYHYYFTNEKQANYFLSYVKSILPDVYQDDLAKASVKKDKADQYGFMLTESQYEEFNRLTRSQMLTTSTTTTAATTTITSTAATTAAEQIAASFKSKGALVKSVRWDNRSFNLKFMAGVTKSATSQPVEDQRKGQHKKYTVYGSGVFERTKKPSPYTGIAPEKITKKKKKRSAFQATSLVLPTAQIPVFGHNKARKDKLVGYLFDADDALINRMFIYDGGTVDRPYEFDTYEQALAYYNKKTDPAHPILFHSKDEFKQAIIKQKNNYNEVLARLRWNVKSSAVGIFSDTLEARCIAQLYARQMEDGLKKQFKELGVPWDDSYHVPIIYYIPGNPKNFEVYTTAEKETDRQQANTILRDESLMKQTFANNDFEFLLLIDDPNEVFKLKFNNELLLQYLLNQGELHLVEALCYRATLTEDQKLSYFKDNIHIHTKKVWELAAKTGHSTLKYMLATPYSYDLIFYETFGDDKTLLDIAAENGHLDAVKRMLAAGVNVRAYRRTGYNSETPLFAAAKNGHLEVVNELLPYYKNYRGINESTIDDLTPLSIAAQNGYLEIVKTLLAHGAEVEYISMTDKKPPIYVAAKKGHLEIVKTLLAHGAKVDPESGKYKTPLYVAAKKGHLEIVKTLLANGANREKTLIRAAQNGQLDVVNELLAYPIHTTDVGSITYYASIALYEAAFADLDVVKAALIHGANVNFANKDGETPLHAAVKSGRLDIMRCLLEKGANIDATRKDGATPLFIAVKQGHINTVNELLLRGANINTDSRDGETPLEIAIERGHWDIVRLLLSNKDIVVNEGAYNAAIKQRNREIIELVASALIKQYKQKLEARKSEYDPTVPFFHNLGLFMGHSKTEKLKALKDLEEAQAKHQQITDKTSLETLQEGKLGKIINELPPDIKSKWGLH